MKYFPTFILALLITALSSPALGQQTSSGPEGIGLSGGLEESATYTLRHSIGEPVIGTWTIHASELRQGFQQSISLSTTAVSAEARFQELKIYPQPVRDFVTLDWTGKELLAGVIHFYEMNGREMTELTHSLYLLPDERKRISTQTLPPGTYFLILTGEGGKQEGTWPLIRLP